jgi:hypothetical protein
MIGQLAIGRLSQLRAELAFLHGVGVLVQSGRRQ